jgi:hypothetical protein
MTHEFRNSPVLKFALVPSSNPTFEQLQVILAAPVLKFYHEIKYLIYWNMEQNVTSAERLIQNRYDEAASHFETNPRAARRIARELLRNPFLPPITRAKCNLMMGWLACDIDDAYQYLEDCRDALAWNTSIGRAPPVRDFAVDIATCEAELQDRCDHPDDNYDLGEDSEDEGLTHEAWLRFFPDDSSAEAPSDEPAAENATGHPLGAAMVRSADNDDVVDDGEEEELAALPPSDARLMRSLSRPADEDSATLAFDPQSDAPDTDVPETDAPETDDYR